MKPCSVVVALALFATVTLAAAAEQRDPPAAKPQPKAEESPKESSRKEEAHRTTEADAGRQDTLRDLKWDMTEVAPIQTHHEIHVGARVLHYTATAGRLPVQDPAGKIDAEMFFVAYTLDGAEPGRRPLTFAFNGGPGSASLWLHMGALGPRKVMLHPEGWQPEAPYRLMDNPHTPLAATDLVLVDAIGTGFSRPADLEKAKKFWGLKGDAEAFGEFIRLFLSRYERWSSPLYLLGESYGTTRSAAVAAYLADRGIQFNGVMLLSMILDFETVRINKRNDLAVLLTLPTYTMIAAYHKRLAPELNADPAKAREEVQRWIWSDYAPALARGDALSPQERGATIDGLARYTGLSRLFLDQANLRVDVREFTHNLLGDQKLRVGRLDGRFAAPDPDGYLGTPFYDPSNAMITAPFASVFNDYARRELGYKTDLPYYTSAGQLSSSSAEFDFFKKWDWGSANEGFPDTATSLRQAMVKDPFLKVLVMEGYYDLATPFAAADYSMSHMDLAPQYRKNISFATYDSGHMVYLRMDALAKFQKDVEDFVAATPKAP